MHSSVVTLRDHANARLAAIVESSFDAIISKDLNSIIRSWNPAAERLFGYTAAEAIGKSILMTIPENRREEEVGIIRQILHGERVETFETVRLKKEGSAFPVSLTVSPVRDDSGAIFGASTILRDITAAKASEERIGVLLREVNHRVKNQYAVILSIVRETVKRSTSPHDFEEKVRNRIMSLARSQDLLVTGEWAGASLADLVAEQLSPFQPEELVVLSGPLVTVTPNAVQYLGMAFHELATNSAKHGVICVAAGQIRVSWHLESIEGQGQRFHLSWEEQFPEPELFANHEIAARSAGFGTVVLKRVVPEALGGSAEMHRSNRTLTWKLTAPFEAVAAERAIHSKS